MNPSLIRRILHPFKTRKWKALKARRDAIPGEPCGGTLMHCKNPFHSEYFLLGVEMDKVWDPKAGDFNR